MRAQREFMNRAQYFINILGVLVVSFVVNIEISPLRYNYANYCFYIYCMHSSDSKVIFW